MGRKDFADDLATAAVLDIPYVSTICPNGDGEFSFSFFSNAVNKTITVTTMVPDVSEYPRSHSFLVFANEDCPSLLSKAIEQAPNCSATTIPHFLTALSDYLCNISTIPDEPGTYHNPINLEGSDDDVHMSDLNASHDYDADSDNDDNDDDDDEVDNQDWGFNDGLPDSQPLAASSKASIGSLPDKQAIQQDLIAVKTAGFKVGVLGTLFSGAACFVNIACRIGKLGISEEAMRAWSVHASQYLVLIIHFPHGYRSLESIRPLSRGLKPCESVRFRVALSDHYKPRSFGEAINFFTSDSGNASLSHTFISKALRPLLNERFIPILGIRLKHGLSWSGAEDMLNDILCATSSTSHLDARKYQQPDVSRKALPDLVNADAVFSLATGSDHLSLPLIAMQFLLRHFVRCTDFCLVCHCRTQAETEAIKPYVCDKPLCLYQYMTLGLGPSIDHEVVTQPLVVDLLVSFCYAAAIKNKLRELPQLHWLVPHPHAPIHGFKPATSLESASSEPRIYGAELNVETMQLLCPDHAASGVHESSWIVVNMDEWNLSWHCRVISTSDFPLIQLARNPQVSREPEIAALKKSDIGAKSAETRYLVTFHIYCVGFDTIPSADQTVMVVLLLELLPDVRTMAQYLTEAKGRELASWTDGMSPAQVGLLRWIVASNRSCIFQIDEIEPESSVDKKSSTEALQLGVRPTEQRVVGLGSWVQFRFAMGSPDKEKRFVQSLAQGDRSFPSIFAWHGSAMSNWHYIVREGLNYDIVANGRAFGNGCYHSPDFMTSLGYSHLSDMYAPGTVSPWPKSVLSIDGAIVLSEIVNAPAQFLSQNPHYVVQHTDWIQTRYLFARPASASKVKTAKDTTLKDRLLQDPRRIPRGPAQNQIELPLSAIPKSRRPNALLHDNPESKSSRKTSSSRKKSTKASTEGADPNPATARQVHRQPETVDVDMAESDGASVSTMHEDRDLLHDSETLQEATSPSAVPATRFTPGPVAQVPTLPPPSYATSKATKTLQKSYMALVATQEEHMQNRKLAELGWYIDTQRLQETGNLYQWIICMHSFPLELPLAQDMQAQDIQSIVFEIRFSANYPFAPPFVRVVRPRFLSFAHGGGGHVTAGGSICMDLLTNSGWNPASSIESILLNIRLAITSTDPQPARLESAIRGPAKTHKRKHGAATAADPNGEYSVAEAVQAFRRACEMHGWQVPADIALMTAGGV